MSPCSQDGSKAWASRGQLTDAGHLLLRYTERLLALSTDAVTATKDVQDVRTGSIYLAASQTPGVYLLPRLIGSGPCPLWCLMQKSQVPLLLPFIAYFRRLRAGTSLISALTYVTYVALLAS